MVNQAEEVVFVWELKSDRKRGGTRRENKQVEDEDDSGRVRSNGVDGGGGCGKIHMDKSIAKIHEYVLFLFSAYILALIHSIARPMTNGR